MKPTTGIERYMTSAFCVIGVVILSAVSQSFAQPTGELDSNASAPETTQSERDRWEGIVELPGMEIEFLVEFIWNEEASTWEATIDIPLQGVDDMPLIDVVHSGDSLSFKMGPPAMATFTATTDPDDAAKASGELNQRGMSFPLRLKRLAANETPTIGDFNRPQTPTPPFPYEAIDVEYRNGEADIGIAGTLTIPEGEGPHPAVVMITGSGAQDRDETLLGHKPFAVIADYLTRRGIAVLRADDRGVGGTEGSISSSTSADFAGDALAGVGFLKSQDEIDATRIGLVGHSEGGIIAPIAASRSDDVAFIVLLAGTGVSGRDVLVRQMRDTLRASGLRGEMLDTMSAAQQQFIDLFIEDPHSHETFQAIRELTILQIAPGFATHPEDMGDDLRKQVDASVELGLMQFESGWFRSFLTFDPKDALREVKCPVLAVNGTLDMQVASDVNLPAIERTLRENGNDDVTIIEFEGLNHLFQKCTTGSPNEYAQIEQTFDEDALKSISDWIREKAELASSDN